METQPSHTYSQAHESEAGTAHKMDEVFNSDDNGEPREDHDYEANSYEQYLSAIKNGNLELFRNILNVHPEYSLRIDPFSGQTSIFEIVQVPDDDVAIEMLKLHKAKDADLAFKDKLKQNITYYIARDGRVKLLNFVTSEGVSANEVDSHHQTPLYYAAREGHTEACKRLIELGLNPNHGDIIKQTCLFYAAKSGHLETCRFLIEHGAKHDHLDKKKQTALFWAKKSGNKELIDYMEALKSQKGQKEKSHSESKSAKKKKSKPDQKFVYNLVYTDENGQKVQMSKEGFQKFIEEYPHLSEYFQNPEKLQGGDKEGESWDKTAKKILQTMWKMRGGFHFHQPVDPIRLNCPDYFDIVKNPMDFGTIKTRLNSNYYESSSGFINDMKLVFSNCILYNGEDTEIGMIGQNLNKEFERLCQENRLYHDMQAEDESSQKDDDVSHRMNEEREHPDTINTIEEEKNEDQSPAMDYDSFQNEKMQVEVPADNQEGGHDDTGAGEFEAPRIEISHVNDESKDDTTNKGNFEAPSIEISQIIEEQKEEEHKAEFEAPTIEIGKPIEDSREEPQTESQEPAGKTEEVQQENKMVLDTETKEEQSGENVEAQKEENKEANEEAPKEEPVQQVEEEPVQQVEEENVNNEKPAENEVEVKNDDSAQAPGAQEEAGPKDVVEGPKDILEDSKDVVEPLQGGESGEITNTITVENVENVDQSKAEEQTNKPEENNTTES